MSFERQGKFVGDNEFIVFGSQAILGSFPDAPEKLLTYFEVDIYPKNRPEGWSLIDGNIGERSMFHETFGYYAHGVCPKVATLPNGWTERWVPCKNENTRGITGWCVEVHDLAISKLAAGREKDLDYVRTLIRHKLVAPAILENRLNETPINEVRSVLFRERLKRLIAEAQT
jgi:hypothetical protein